MKESTQTILFLGAALAAVAVATQVQPTDATYKVDALIGQPLFPAFETEAAKSLRIVRFNEETATLRDFEVAAEDGVWSIPSKGGYPADAESQMAEASTGVIDLEVLSIATQSAEDHEEYGVVEPADSLEVGASGVGTRVTLNDDAGEALVDVVIGKEVKGAGNQHYVRRTSQDVVFTVAIDPEKFSTSFEDWIEDDLLDLDPWDISRVRVRDYSAELVMQGMRPAIAFDPRGDYSLTFSESDNKWSPLTLRRYNREAEDYRDFELTAEQKLNEDTLTALKNAVGDLRIVDVERKPSGLSADLKAGDDFFGNRDAVQSLMERGFAPTKGEGDATEVLSSEGEVIVTTKEGIEYVLRFGNLQLSADGEEGSDGAGEAAGPDDAPAEGDKADGDKADDTRGVNRYLFVMARFNDTLIEKPTLEELPAEEATDEEAEDAEDDADDKKTSEEDAAKEEESEEESEDSPEEKAEEKADSRAEVEKRNRRAEEEYDARVKKSQDRVAELNARFGDWYYVIADDVYKKVAVGEDDLLMAADPVKPADDATTGPAGPLGATGAGVPGLPDVPGVEFNPSAEKAEEAATEDGSREDNSADDNAADEEASAESAEADAPEAGATEAESPAESPDSAETPNAAETDAATDPAPAGAEDAGEATEK